MIFTAWRKNSRYKVFRQGSTTFFVSSLFFPQHVREDVFTLYRWVRICDNFVDKFPQQPAELVRYRKQTLAAIAGQASGDRVIDSFAQLAVRHRFDQRWIEAFLDAMASDLDPQPFETLSDTEHYMYGSADVIGLMMAAIMELEPAAYPFAGMQGKAFQFINFLRDIDEDQALGRTYFPREILGRYGLAGLSAAQAEANREGFAAFVREQVERYLGWQAEAAKGYAMIPRRYRIPIQTAAKMYEWTAREIAHDPWVIYRRQVKPSKWQVYRTVLRQLFWFGKPARGLVEGV